MAIYTGSKSGTGDAYPHDTVDSASWKRMEPMLTPDKLRQNFLFGIPLVSQIPDPITKKAQVMTDAILQDYIVRAVAKAEEEANLLIMPVQLKERHPFDRGDYLSYGYLKTNKRPIASVEAFTVTTADGTDIFTVPNDWIEPGYLHRGQLNIIPITAAYSNSFNTGTAGTVAFLNFLGTHHWLPAFFYVKYTAGFTDGNVPVVVNELIGTIAAMNILSQLAVTYAKSTSTSISIDGVSQSVGTPGPNIFAVRMQELAEERKRLVGQIKRMVGQRFPSNNV